MGPGYDIAQIGVTSPGVCKHDVAKDGPAAAAAPQRRARMLSGRRAFPIGFSVRKAAGDCYHSVDHAAAGAVRMPASTRIQTIVEGL